MRHQDLQLNHKIESYTYADAAARTGASGFVAGDVGRIAFQQDKKTYWRLTATTPAWESVAGVQVSCRVTHSAATPIATATEVPLAFDTERYDTDNIHSTSSLTQRLTCNTAGVYYIFGNVSFTPSAAGNRRALSIKLNDTVIIAFQEGGTFAGGTVSILNVSCLQQMIAGSYVTLTVFQDSGVSLDIQKSDAYSPEFGMCKVG